MSSEELMNMTFFLLVSVNIKYASF